MPWKTKASDFVRSPIGNASNGEVAGIFDNYKRVKVEFNMNPVCVATKKGGYFVTYTPKNAQMAAYTSIEHKDEVTEVSWLPDGQVCWTMTEGPMEVGTGLPAELIKYCDGYGVSGPYTAPHTLVWDVFNGLAACEDVVLVLDGVERLRVTLSPIMPLIYAGIESLGDQYNLEAVNPVDLLTLGWSYLLMLVPEAEGCDLTKLLPQVGPVIMRVVTKALLIQRSDDILGLGDYEEDAMWADQGLGRCGI